MKDNVILEVKNVEKFFYGNKKLFQKDRPVVKAVNDVSFTINEGETFGYLNQYVFADAKEEVMEPDAEDVKGFDAFMQDYIKGLAAEKGAVEGWK